MNNNSDKLQVKIRFNPEQASNATPYMIFDGENYITIHLAVKTIEHLQQKADSLGISLEGFISKGILFYVEKNPKA